MSMVGAEQAMIDSWVKARLMAQAVMLNAISPGLSVRIFNLLAPPQTVWPYIIFQAQSPPEVIRGVGSAEVMVDTIYVVKAVAQSSDYAGLAPVAAAIHLALVVDEGDATDDGLIFTCRYERQFSMTETDQAKQFRHLGGEYRIQAQAA